MHELVDDVFEPDARVRLLALIKMAERESKVHRDAVLALPRSSVKVGLARWHYSHARERERALKEAWMIVTGRPF
jgi:hypothetical protein